MAGAHVPALPELGVSCRGLGQVTPMDTADARGWKNTAVCLGGCKCFLLLAGSISPVPGIGGTSVLPGAQLLRWAGLGAGSCSACRAGGVLTALLRASTATSCSLRAAGGTHSQQMGLPGFWQRPQQEAYGRSWGHGAEGTSNAPRFFLCVHGAMNDREVRDLLGSQGQEQRNLHHSSLPKQ